MAAICHRINSALLSPQTSAISQQHQYERKNKKQPWHRGKDQLHNRKMKGYEVYVGDKALRIEQNN